MKLFIGLGNYGDQYAHTRHNAGFEVIDRLSDRWHIPVTRARCHGLIGEGTVGGERVALIKPQTYMNLSGDCVAAFAPSAARVRTMAGAISCSKPAATAFRASASA